MLVHAWKGYNKIIPMFLSLKSEITLEQLLGEGSGGVFRIGGAVDKISSMSTVSGWFGGNSPGAFSMLAR